ncbi:hypothetical protein NDU88_005125 [Pleurodeles waltl]|uniref:Uncharacterized protein n=1 Tax=Pleurodeles waltl TaxID=8319 RepID=A0AAV7VKL4_PLEWA|nr:hypothetical protein NDU88_005125 [Pleurodeles waltl]
MKSQEESRSLEDIVPPRANFEQQVSDAYRAVGGTCCYEAPRRNGGAWEMKAADRLDPWIAPLKGTGIARDRLGRCGLGELRRAPPEESWGRGPTGRASRAVEARPEKYRNHRRNRAFLVLLHVVSVVASNPGRKAADRLDPWIAPLKGTGIARDRLGRCGLGELRRAPPEESWGRGPTGRASRAMEARPEKYRNAPSNGAEGQ